MQAWVQDAAVRRSRARHFVFVMTFVVAVLRGLDIELPAQSDITEADLTAASAGRTIRLERGYAIRRARFLPEASSRSG